MTNTAEPISTDRDLAAVAGLTIASGAQSCTIRLTGELDHAVVAVLHGAVDGHLADGCRRLVIDVADLRFIDAAGFRALSAARDRARERGGTLVVVGHDAFFAELARICDAEDVLERG